MINENEDILDDIVTPVPEALQTDDLEFETNLPDNEEVGLFEFKRFKADPKQSSVRLDKFVLDRVEKISRTRIQNAIKEGNIKVNDKEVKPSHKISPGEEVVLYVPDDPFDYVMQADDIPIDVRYEDDDILILHKPAGLVCHPGVGNYTGTLVNGLLHYFQNKYLPIREGHEHYQPGLVHRIDKDTSGLLVIAKSDLAMQSLSKQFNQHTVQRTYQAIVWGQPDKAEGTINVNIARDPHDALRFAAFPENDWGKHAITHYSLLDPMYYVSLLECRLETGRTHQIRVHLKHLGHPLFSDTRYGGSEILKGTIFTRYKQFVQQTFKALPRQGLHAKTLGFKHPATGKDVFFDSALPPDMELCLSMWRDYLSNRKAALE